MLFDSRTLVWVFPFVILSFGLGSSLQAQEKKRPSVKPLERPLENRTEPKPSTDNAKPLPARELKGSNVPWVEESDLPIDSWEVLYVKNSPVGVRHLQVVLSNVETLSKTKLVESKSESTLRLSMKGEILEQKVIVETTEELDGKLNAVKATFRIGESETKLQGEAKGNNQFILRVTKDGAEPVTKTIEWSKESRGPFALEQSLRRNPMEKGESRVIKYLDPVFADIAQTELRAFGMIKTPSLDGRVVELMEIECITRLGDNGLRNIVWVDGKGSTEKTYISFLDLRGFKCNEAEAKRIEDVGALDLYVIKPIVVSKRSTPILPQDSSVEYSVSMKNDDPVLFLSKQSNQIPVSRSLNDAKVYVYRIDADSKLPEKIAKANVTPDQRSARPSSLIESDDEQVKLLAEKFVKAKRADETIIQALNRGVFETIAKTEFSKDFLSAAQVAVQLKGDCSEHAVLLAAVARTQKIPSRLAYGMRYVPSETEPTMVFHIWTEVWFNGRWVPFDPSSGEYPVPPDRIKFLESYLEDGNAAAPMLTALRGMAQLMIRVKGE